MVADQWTLVDSTFEDGVLKIPKSGDPAKKYAELTLELTRPVIVEAEVRTTGWAEACQMNLFKDYGKWKRYKLGWGGYTIEMGAWRNKVRYGHGSKIIDPK